VSTPASAPAGTATVVRLEDLGRSFGPTRALDGVTLDLRGGEVLAVAGAYGAGKSTLNRILAGALAPDTGRILVDGEPVRLADPQDAVAAGIRTVHQHAGEWTVPGLTVAENLLLEELATRRGVGFSPRRSREAARRIAAGLRLEFTDAQLAADVSTLGVSERQLIALARALATSPRVLILDEPTSALSAVEAERLFDVVRGLRDDGVAIVYVSHRLGELEALADRVAVLRDGRLRRVFERPFAMRDVVAEVLGEIVGEIEHAERQGGRVRVLLEDLRVLPGGPAIDVGFAAGEVTGLTVLIGAGKSELAEVLFGVRAAHGGRVLLDGSPFAPGSPGAAIAAGVFMVPEDRAAQALVPGWSVRANASLPFLARLARLGLVRRRAEADRARQVIETRSIVCAGPEAPIGSLSGGNQQKVVVGRWLAEDARVLIFDEPFRGVDIGARRDIAHRLRALSDDVVVLVISSDLDEILEVADRVLVLAGGAIVADTRRSRADRTEIALEMTGAHA
jgi:simple sugar transport system ATP-binding protein